MKFCVFTLVVFFLSQMFINYDTEQRLRAQNERVKRLVVVIDQMRKKELDYQEQADSDRKAINFAITTAKASLSTEAADYQELRHELAKLESRIEKLETAYGKPPKE